MANPRFATNDEEVKTGLSTLTKNLEQNLFQLYNQKFMQSAAPSLEGAHTGRLSLLVKGEGSLKSLYEIAKASPDCEEKTQLISLIYSSSLALSKERDNPYAQEFANLASSITTANPSQTAHYDNYMTILQRAIVMKDNGERGFILSPAAVSELNIALDNISNSGNAGDAWFKFEMGDAAAAKLLREQVLSKLPQVAMSFSGTGEGSVVKFWGAKDAVKVEAEPENAFFKKVEPIAVDNSIVTLPIIGQYSGAYCLNDYSSVQEKDFVDVLKYDPPLLSSEVERQMLNIVASYTKHAEKYDAKRDDIVTPTKENVLSDINKFMNNFGYDPKTEGAMKEFFKSEEGKVFAEFVKRQVDDGKFKINCSATCEYIGFYPNYLRQFEVAYQRGANAAKIMDEVFSNSGVEIDFTKTITPRIVPFIAIPDEDRKKLIAGDQSIMKVPKGKEKMAEMFRDFLQNRYDVGDVHSFQYLFFQNLEKNQPELYAKFAEVKNGKAMVTKDEDNMYQVTTDKNRLADMNGLISFARALAGDKGSIRNELEAAKAFNVYGARTYEFELTNSIQLGINMLEYQTNVKSGDPTYAKFKVDYSVVELAEDFTQLKTQIVFNGVVKARVFDEAGALVKTAEIQAKDIDPKTGEYTFTFDTEKLYPEEGKTLSKKYTVLFQAENKSQSVGTAIVGAKVFTSETAQEKVVITPLKTKEIAYIGLPKTENLPPRLILIPPEVKVSPTSTQVNVYGKDPIDLLYNIINSGGDLSQLNNVYLMILALPEAKLKAWQNSIKGGDLQGFFQLLQTDPAAAMQMVKEGTPLYNLVIAVQGSQSLTDKSFAKIKEYATTADASITWDAKQLYGKTGAYQYKPWGVLSFYSTGQWKTQVVDVAPKGEASFSPFKSTSLLNTYGVGSSLFIVPASLSLRLGTIYRTNRNVFESEGETIKSPKDEQMAISTGVTKLFTAANKFVISTGAEGAVPISKDKQYWLVNLNVGISPLKDSKVKPSLRFDFNYQNKDQFAPYGYSLTNATEFKLSKNLKFGIKAGIGRSGQDLIGDRWDGSAGFYMIYKIDDIIQIKTGYGIDKKF